MTIEHTDEATEVRMLNGMKDIVDIQVIPRTTMETPTVDKTLATFHRQWTKTAEDCLLRADELESAAAELRSRASALEHARNFLEDVKQSVLYEIESRNRAMSLAMVNPSVDG